MTAPHSPGLPEWVYKRDGRRVPFEADKINQALFAATEQLRQPNAFLARELTESVLHFLCQETGDTIPSTTHIAELTAKIVRELGHPSLAQALAEKGKDKESRKQRNKEKKNLSPTIKLPGAVSQPNPRLFLEECLRLYSLHNLFSRDLAASQEEGWVTLLGLDHPTELESGVLDWPGREGRSLLAALLQGRRQVGGMVALDGPEYALASSFSLLPGAGGWGDESQRMTHFVQDLHEGLEATGLGAVVNLNTATPPAWADQTGEGPLFETSTPQTNISRFELTGALLETLLNYFSPQGPVRVDWHLGEKDFPRAAKSSAGRVPQAALRGALTHGQVSFVFDRPGRPLALGEGLDRQHPAILQLTALHLVPLVEMAGVEGDEELLLQKLFNLVRMAVSAAVQKRRFLRQHETGRADLQRGFFLDRARLMVIPVGLAAVVQRLTGQGMGTGKAAMELARKIVQRLHQYLPEAGREANVETVLDSPWWTTARGSTGALFSSPHLVGLTCADLTADPLDQLRAGGQLHQITRNGTATVLLSPEQESPEYLADLLSFAWKKTDVVRVRFAKRP